MNAAKAYRGAAWLLAGMLVSHGVLAAPGDVLVGPFSAGPPGVVALAASADGGVTTAVGMQPPLDANGHVQAEGFLVQTQRYGAQGEPLAPALMSTVTTQGGYALQLGVGIDGAFVASWTRTPSNFIVEPLGVYVRAFPADGAAASAEVRADDASEVPGFPSSIARRTDGGFVVAWPRKANYTGGIAARQFAMDASPMGSVFSAGGPPAISWTYEAAVAMNSAGAFAVGWSQGLGALLLTLPPGGFCGGLDGGGCQVYALNSSVNARRFRADAAPISLSRTLDANAGLGGMALT